MNLTYRLENRGYVIMNNDVDWIVQNEYIPFPASTIEESAKIHIDDIIKSRQMANKANVSI